MPKLTENKLAKIVKNWIEYKIEVTEVNIWDLNISSNYQDTIDNAKRPIKDLIK
jgi:hypothetical protein